MSPDDVRSFLRQQLPAYSLPNVIVPLPALPLTASGKVDRLALPDLPEPAPHGGLSLPETRTEEAIAEVWADILHRDHVGVDSNFFDIGGHSLLLVQVHERLCRMFLSPISITDLFQYPTVRTLAAFCTGLTPESAVTNTT